MRKYKAPGAYGHFIPTENTVKSSQRMRIMAMVGTGQQFFEKKNVLINRQSGSVIDELPDKNIIEIHTISSKPIQERIDTTNKIYSDYELKDGNYIKWKSLEGLQYSPKIELLKGQGDEGFLTNIFAEINDQDLIKDMEFKIEIVFIDHDMGTYRVTNLTTQQVLGEYSTSNLFRKDIIQGINLKVLSTFVLGSIEDGNMICKTKIGDYVIVKTTASKCHMDPIVEKIDNSKILNDTLNLVNNGSNYDLPNAGQDAGSVVNGETVEYPSLINNVNCLKDLGNTKFKIKIYKNGGLIESSKIFNKLLVSINGKVKGNSVNIEDQVIFDVNDTPNYPASSIYDLTNIIPGNILKGLFENDNFSIKFSYVLNGKPDIDHSDVSINLQIINIVTDSETALDVEEKIAETDNMIFVNSDILPKKVENADTIFFNCIENLKVIHPETIVSATYKIKINNIKNNEISIYKIEQDENGENLYKLLGTYSSNNNAEFREAIPGVIFTLNPFDKVEGLTEMYGSLNGMDNSGSTVIISTIAGIDNSNIPKLNSNYYVSYKYAKSEEDYEPKIFYDFDEIRKSYGNYIITPNNKIINSLTLGAEIAMENGASPIICVQAKNETQEEMTKAIDKLAKKIGFIDNINCIVPLTSSKQIGEYLINHVTELSSPQYSMYRMAYLSCGDNELINKEPTINDSSEGSIQIARNYNNERIVYVVPGKVSKQIIDPITGFATVKQLPGYYLAAAVAAIAMSNDPAEPLTNKELKGFKDLLTYYSDPEMNTLASAGCLVVKQEGSTIQIRHGITTHGNIDTLADIQSNEITLVQIKDYVLEGCRKVLGDLYVGGKLKPSIIHDIEYTITNLLNRYISDEIIIGVEELTVKRNLNDPRQVDVKFLVEAVYPLNYIDISFGFSTTMS